MGWGGGKRVSFTLAALAKLVKKDSLVHFNGVLGCSDYSDWKSAYLNVCLFSAVNQCPR